MSGALVARTNGRRLISRGPIGRGGKSSGFLPPDIAGLLAWYCADTLGLANAAAVASWPDSSGNGRALAQAGGTLQPVFNTAQQNGLGAVTFDGTNDYMATSAFASPTAGCSIFAVQKLTALNQYRTLLCHAAAATWISPYARVLTRVTDNAGGGGGGGLWQFIVQDAGAGGNTVNDVTLESVTWQLMEFVYDQTNMRQYRNGTQIATVSRSGALTSSTQPLFIGADVSLTGNYKGQIGELVYYNAGLSTANRGVVEAYLRAKWGV